METSDETYRMIVQQVMQSVGKQLMEVVLHRLGNGPRSEVELAADLLRKIVFHYTQTSKEWMSELLSQANFPPTRLNTQEKSQFINKVILLRGKRSTREVAREFWIACRGTELGWL